MTHDEFVAHIRARYASLFDPDNSEDAWSYLITIGPGWHALVDEYCQQAEAVLREHNEIGRWFIRQVKEKLGELRIYMRPAPYERPDVDGFMQLVDDIDSPEPTPVEGLLGDLRNEIVERSVRTCEDCGEPGEWRNLDGWYATCCTRHFEEWKARKAAR